MSMCAGMCIDMHVAIRCEDGLECLKILHRCGDMCIRMCMVICTDTCINMCMDTCMDMCMDICMDTCMDICMDMYVHGDVYGYAWQRDAAVPGPHVQNG